MRAYVRFDRGLWIRAEQVLVGPDGRGAVPAREQAVLEALADAGGAIVPVDDLRHRIWGRDGSRRSVHAALTRLRRRVERDPTRPRHLLGVPGGGLRLEIDRPPPLPAPVDRFVGREDDLRRIRAAIDGASRRVTVAGAGGVGKSRVLLELGRRLAAEGRHPVWNALGAAPTAAAATAAIAGALGASRPAAIAPVLARLAVPVLLVDDADRVPWTEPVAAWLAAAPRAVVVAAAHAPLGGPDEQVVALGPWTPPTPRRCSPRGCARSSPRGRDPDGDALLAALDGLPLSIELCAPAVAVGRAADVLAGRSLDLARRREGPARHGSLRACLADTWTRADPAARRTWMRLALFDGPFEEAEARALDTDPGLLRARGLLQQRDGALAMLAAVRAYGRERLEEDPGRVDAEAAHGQALRRLSEHERALEGPGAAEGRRILVTRLSDLRAEATRALARADLAVLADVTFAAVCALELRGPIREAVERLDACAELAARDPSGADVRIAALDRAAELVALLGGVDEAAARLDAVDALPDPSARARARRHRVRALGVERGRDPARCEALLVRSAEACAAVGDPAGEVAARSSLGALLVHLGRFDDAERELSRALAQCERDGNLHRAAVARGGLASVAAFRGDPARAQALLGAAIDGFAAVGDARNEAIALGNRGMIRAEAGDRDAAVDLGRAAEASLRVGDERTAATLSLVRSAGRGERGIAEAPAALAVVDLAGDARWGAIGRLVLCDLHAAAGRDAEARPLAVEALRRAAAAGDRVVEAEATAALAALDRDPAGADRALALARACGVARVVVRALVGRAAALRSAGDPAALEPAQEAERLGRGRSGGPPRARVLAELAACHEAVGDAAAARRWRAAEARER